MEEHQLKNSILKKNLEHWLKKQCIIRKKKTSIRTLVSSYKTQMKIRTSIYAEDKKVLKLS